MLVIEWEGGWDYPTYRRYKKFNFKKLKFNYFVERHEPEPSTFKHGHQNETFQIRKKDYKRGSDHQMFRIYKKMNKVIKVG